MSRPTADDVMLQMATLVAQRSLCVRRNGAVVVGPDGRVAATGYNGAPAGFDHGGLSCRSWCPHSTRPGPSPDYDDCVSLHAEVNAIAHANRDEMVGGTIYVTRPPCLGCAKLIAAAGIERAVFPGDPTRMFGDSSLVVDFLGMCGVEVTQT